MDRAGSHFTNELPFVLYRMPNEKKVKGIFQQNAREGRISFSENGFVFAPFSNQKKTLWLQPDSCFYADQPNATYHPNSISEKVEGGADHKSLVKKAIATIDRGVMKKVVLSKPISVAKSVVPITLFERAIKLYEAAFCYLWFHPQSGIWLGASPEQLAMAKNGYFQTTALAGTLPKTDDKLPKWTPKEYEEQEMVTHYLEEQLNQYLTEMTVEPRKSILAGSLWHQKTNISGQLRNTATLKDVIDSIHPTSAVCGLPKTTAMNFILENEGYNRAYYTGYLGEVKGAENDASIFVNLRCLQIFENEVRIYVGGGITKDSNPQKEWDELVNKSSIMLALL